eukprot:TRINITY_DN498_c0_g1_i1.p1 TRINITY_DN498_c0_g1~~TRINITY_DN498_c0_g1_i1.p1  ORF type:complete len:406 (+),score=94.06 TRINITY_DN498_c0_g1_i1:185-1402(+)
MDNTPSTYWGIILLVLSFVIFVPSMIVNHINRNNKLYVQRSYPLLLLQNFGLVAGVVVMGVYLAMGNSASCEFVYWVEYLPLATVSSPFFVRTYVFAVRYFLTKERERDLHYSSDHHPRLQRYLNMLDSRVVTIMMALLFLLQLLPAIIFTGLMPSRFRNLSLPIMSRGVCPFIIEQLAAAIALFVFYIIFGIVIAVLLWSTNDAFFIKRELRNLSFVWIVCLVIYIPDVFLQGAFIWYLPLSALLVLAMLAHFIISSTWIAYLDYKRSKVETIDADLHALLKQPEFRIRFKEFLISELCVESLIFYDAVQAFKAAPEQEQASDAAIIVVNFIQPGSFYEINIAGETREKIESSVKAHRIELDLFDAAVNEILTCMKYQSLPHFLLEEKEVIVNDAFNISLTMSV